MAPIGVGKTPFYSNDVDPLVNRGHAGLFDGYGVGWKIEASPERNQLATQEAALAHEMGEIRQRLESTMTDAQRSEVRTRLAENLGKQFDLRQKRHGLEIEALEIANQEAQRAGEEAAREPRGDHFPPRGSDSPRGRRLGLVNREPGMVRQWRAFVPLPFRRFTLLILPEWPSWYNRRSIVARGDRRPSEYRDITLNCRQADETNSLDVRDPWPFVLLDRQRRG